jgi:predicted ATPase/Tfp pilus assembly protein PilF/tRNA A-37 threonylcarbamoyl transferase component Bud32
VDPVEETLPGGTVLGDRYRIVRCIGSGGVGVVYEAVNTVIGKRVAIKCLRNTVVRSDKNLHRFLQEASASAIIDHEHIIEVMDFLCLDDGLVFMVMEYLEGQNIQTLIQTEGQQPLARAIQIVTQICRALVAAHDKGVIHRDLKPANIFLVPRASNPDFVKVLDFGISKFTDREGEQLDLKTKTGAILGTAWYMAPEQLKGSAGLDHRADIYSLGVIFFELLTGHLPFEAQSWADLILSVFSETPSRLCEYRSGLPAQLQPVCDRLLARNPSDRYQSCAEVERALSVFAGGLGGTVERTAPGQAASNARPVATMEFVSVGAGSARVGGPKHKTNILAATDAFVGRAAELDELARQVGDRQRLITLVGMGGAGKTRLSQHFGREQLTRFQGGVWFCDLTGATNAAGIVGTLAAALDVPLTQRDPAEHLAGAIAALGRTLIILDNLEQVADEAAQIVARWMGVAPEAVFLVTSRVLLRIAGEQVLRVGPLAQPDAISLFYERARAVQSDFVRTGDNEPIVQEIVERLEGLSLAVELAAARMRMLTPARVLERLSERFKLLRGQRRDQSSRQTTLRGAIDWSWDLLDPVEQATLAQLSVFRSGFTLEAAEAVVDVSHFDQAPWVLDLVQALVDHSLVRREESLPGHDRYRMFETIREYAGEKLGSDTHGASLRHARFFATFGDEAFIDRLWRRGGVLLRQRFMLEFDNLVAGMHGAIAAGDHDLAAQIGLAAAWFLVLRGPSADGVELLAKVSMECVSAPIKARLLDRGAHLLRNSSQPEAALASYEAAMACYRQLNDSYGLARVMGVYGGYLFELGRVAEGQVELERALAMSQEVGNALGEGVAEFNLGVVADGQVRATVAREHYERALVLFRKLGYRRYEGGLLNNLGCLVRKLGHHAQAVAYLEQALAMYREEGDRMGECVTLGNLGITLYNEGDVSTAENYLAEAIDIGDQVRPMLAGASRGALAVIRAEQQKIEEARALFVDGESQLRGVYPTELAKVLCKRADFEHTAGEDRVARVAFEEAESIAADLAITESHELGQMIEALRHRLRS